MTDDREPFREAAERCSKCGSNRFVAVSLDRGTSRRAQCIPCGHIEPAALPKDWESPHRRTDDRAEMQAARSAGLQKRHEQRLENATYTAAEVKVLTETASKVSYALGRKDALTEIANEMAVEQEYLSYVTFQTDRETALLLMAAKTSSQDPLDAPEPRTHPSGYSDLPQDPQAVREAP